MRLIDADALTNILCGCKCKDCMFNDSWCKDNDYEIANILQTIHDAPTVIPLKMESYKEREEK